MAVHSKALKITKPSYDQESVSFSCSQEYDTLSKKLYCVFFDGAAHGTQFKWRKPRAAATSFIVLPADCKSLVRILVVSPGIQGQHNVSIAPDERGGIVWRVMAMSAKLPCISW